MREWFTVDIWYEVEAVAVLPEGIEGEVADPAECAVDSVGREQWGSSSRVALRPKLPFIVFEGDYKGVILEDNHL